MAAAPITVSSPEAHRNWLDLPRDVTVTILLKLGAVEILENAQKVCSLWHNLCKDPSMWRSIDLRNLGDLHNGGFNLEKLAIRAVDLSRGQFVDINIEYFGTDDLLDYVSSRSSCLRRLRLVSCYDISDDAMIENVKKLNLLEEVEISYCSFSEECLAALGHSCPLLKSFKLNNTGFWHPSVQSDDEALVIAAHMHELRHLQLFGNKLTNIGLQAILDGCPKLESLDLRQCFNVNLQEGAGKACVEQIKCLRGPDDSTNDYEFDAEVQNYEHEYEYEYEYPDYYHLGFLSSDEEIADIFGGSDLSDYDLF